MLCCVTVLVLKVLFLLLPYEVLIRSITISFWKIRYCFYKYIGVELFLLFLLIDYTIIPFSSQIPYQVQPQTLNIFKSVMDFHSISWDVFR